MKQEKPQLTFLCLARLREKTGASALDTLVPSLNFISFFCFIMATMSGGAHLGIPAASQGVGGRSQRRKDSSPSARFWESPDTLAELEVVRQWIGKHYKKVSSRRRKLKSQELAAPCSLAQRLSW